MLSSICVLLPSYHCLPSLESTVTRWAIILCKTVKPACSMLINIRTPLLLALFWICTNMLSFAVAGEPLVSHLVVTDVTPVGFSVVWISSEPSTCSLRVFDDQHQELSGLTLVSESGLHPPAEDLGVMKARVIALHPDTSYYFQTVTTSKADGKVTIYPSVPMSVQTEISTEAITNDVLVHRILQRDGSTSAVGVLLMAEVDGGSYPISGWVGDQIDEPYARIELSNLYSQNSHTSLELVGGEGITLTSIGGSLGFRVLSGTIPPPDNGTFQTLQPVPSDAQCTLSTDADNDGMLDDFEVTYGLDPLDAGDVTLDPDNDGQNNLQEHNLGTNPRVADTDGDGCDDGVEVSGGRNPALSDPQGDLNTDCALNLQDAIIALQIPSSTAPGTGINVWGDVNGDGKIDLADAIYILQKVSGVRQ